MRIKGRGKITLFILTVLLLIVVVPGCSATEENATEENATEENVVEEKPVAEPEDNSAGDKPEFEEMTLLEELLEDVHPDEPVEYTLQERFSLQSSFDRLEQIRELAEKEELDFEDRMALYNWAGALEGTLRLQEYESSKLQFELMRDLYTAGEIGESELEKAEEGYEKALQDFLDFWEEFTLAD